MFDKTITEHNPSNSNKDTDFIINKVDASEEGLIYGLYSNLMSYDQHVQIIQSKYRNMSAAWLLSTFVGIGYSFLATDISFLLGGWATGIVIASVGILGIISFWQLDLTVYQCILQAIMTEEVKLEKNYSFLPDLKTEIKQIKDKQKVGLFQGSFYVTCTGMLFLVICSFLFLGLYEKGLKIAIASVILACLGSLSLLYYMKIKTIKVHRKWLKH